MTKKALVILAEGAEEMETVVTVDVLRRGGVEVTLAGLDGDGPVTCSRKVRVVPDVALSAARGEFDAVVLPGGAGGAKRLAASKVVGELLRAQAGAGRLVAAICAAPIALAAHEVLGGRRMTCHPSVNAEVARHGKLVDEPVVVDGNLVTSQGPGTAMDFGLALVTALCGQAKMAEIREPMRIPD